MAETRTEQDVAESLILAGADPEPQDDPIPEATDNAAEETIEPTAEADASGTEDDEAGTPPVQAEAAEAADGEAEAAAPAAEQVQEVPEPQSPMIPKSRFDEINEKRKAAERKIQQFEEQQKAAETPNYDFDAKEKEYMEAVLDGRADDALSIRREIRTAEEAQFRRVAEQQATEARTRTKEDLKVQDAIEDLQQRFEVFDTEAEGYNQDLVDETLVLQRSFMQEGYEPDAALYKAARYVTKLNDVRDRTAAAVEESKPEGLSAETPTHTEEQAQAKLDLASKQPTDVPATNRREPPIDIFSMPPEEFDKLSEAQIRKMRGDFRVA